MKKKELDAYIHDGVIMIMSDLLTRIFFVALIFILGFLIGYFL